MALLLSYVVPSWGFPTETLTPSELREPFHSIPVYCIVIPLEILDVTVVIAMYKWWGKLFRTQKIAYMLYSIFLGFPLGTATKILVSLYYGDVDVPKVLLFAPLLAAFSLTVMGIFLYFCWCGHCCLRDGDRTRPLSWCCFIQFMMVTALLLVFCLCLASSLDNIWPVSITSPNSTLAEFDFLPKNWFGWLIPVWILLAFVFLLCTASLLDKFFSGTILFHDF